MMKSVKTVTTAAASTFACCLLFCAYGAAMRNNEAAANETGDADSLALALDKSAIELSDLGKAHKVILAAPCDWSLAASEAWLHVDQTGGKAGKATLKVSADKRKDRKGDRTGEILITAGDQTAKITVTQGPAGAYYDDGYVLQLRKHTKGNGVVLVGIGDGFARADLRKGGEYETHMRSLFEDYILDCEVFRDFRDYFDVYLYMAESAEAGVWSGTDNAFGSGGPVNWDKMLHCINDHPVFQKAGKRCPDNIAVVFAGNGMIGGYAYFETRLGVYSFAEGLSYYWAAHEFGGHGFAGLSDEYVSNCEYMGGADTLKAYQDRGKGICMNVSWTTDTTLYWKDDGGVTASVSESNGLPCVPWKDFLNHPQYAGNNAVDFHEGGFYCPTGIWRPEAASVMIRKQGGKEHYNAQSRWIIYRKIHDLAGVPYTFDQFVKYDVKNLLP